MSKNSSVMALSEDIYIYGGAYVAVHFRCSLPTMEATSVPAPAEYISILIPPSYIDETLLGQLLSRGASGI